MNKDIAHRLNILLSIVSIRFSFVSTPWLTGTTTVLIVAKNANSCLGKRTETRFQEQRWSLPCYSKAARRLVNQSALSMCYDLTKLRENYCQLSMRTESWLFLLITTNLNWWPIRMPRLFQYVGGLVAWVSNPVVPPLALYVFLSLHRLESKWNVLWKCKRSELNFILAVLNRWTHISHIIHNLFRFFPCFGIFSIVILKWLLEGVLHGRLLFSGENYT